MDQAITRATLAMPAPTPPVSAAPRLVGEFQGFVDGIEPSIRWLDRKNMPQVGDRLFAIPAHAAAARAWSILLTSANHGVVGPPVMSSNTLASTTSAWSWSRCRPPPARHPTRSIWCCALYRRPKPARALYRRMSGLHSSATSVDRTCGEWASIETGAAGGTRTPACRARGKAGRRGQWSRHKPVR